MSKQWLILTVGLMLLLMTMLLLAACDDDDETEEPTTTTSQATATTSARPTSTQLTTATASDKPVKIGVLSAWTGPLAMMGLFYTDPIIKVVEKQVEAMGGILEGRPVKFVRYDSGGQTAKAIGGAKKLLMDDKVSVLAIGGSSPAEASAVADVAEEEKVLFACVTPILDVADREYTVVCSISSQVSYEDPARLILELMIPRPQTAGFLSYEDPEMIELYDELRQKLEAAGIEIVYEEYVTVGTMDFSPYLTKVKYADPDVIHVVMDAGQYLAIAKQITELGGWGDIKLSVYGLASPAAHLPGAEGWFVISPWHPSLDDPESLKFKESFEAVNGRLPTDLHVYFYNTLWTAIHAIELAGNDDPVEVAKAARSGNLEFDTPMGRAVYGTDGNNGLRNIFVQIHEGGVMVPLAE